MKKKLIAAILACTLALSVLPGAAFAQETGNAGVKPQTVQAAGGAENGQIDNIVVQPVPGDMENPNLIGEETSDSSPMTADEVVPPKVQEMTSETVGILSVRPTEKVGGGAASDVINEEVAPQANENDGQQGDLTGNIKYVIDGVESTGNPSMSVALAAINSADANAECFIYILKDTITFAVEQTVKHDVTIMPGGGLQSVTIQYGPDHSAGGMFYLSDGCEVKMQNLILDGTNIANKEALIQVSDGASLSLENVTLQNNHSASNGGAIYANGSQTKVVLNSCTIQNNQAVNGGAIYGENGAVISAPNSTNAVHIVENQAQNGGALYLSGNGSAADFKQVELFDNTATENGGAVFVQENAKFIANTVQIKGNSATQNGGGIYVANAEVTLERGAGGYDDENVNSGIVNNQAANGGGIYVSGTSQITIGNSNTTVGINRNTGKGGGIYIALGGVTVNMNGADVRLNHDPNAADLADNWAEETVCGGIYAAADATLFLSGKVLITENTAGESGNARLVNLLIENDEKGQSTSVYNNAYGAGLSSGSKIGVSLKYWPKADEYFLLEQPGEDDSYASSGHISDAYQDYFISDRAPYNKQTMSGTFRVVVNTEAKEPTGSLVPNTKNANVYLTAQAVPVPAVQFSSKYYDGTTDAKSITLSWMDVPDAHKNLFDSLQAGTDYTLTAAFTDENVTYDSVTGQPAAQQVTGTLEVKDQEILALYPTLTSSPISGSAVIYPIPLAASLVVEDKYFDGTTSAQAQVNLAVDAGTATAPGLTLPGNIPSGHVPAAGTDYTVGTAQFTVAQATELVAASAPVTWGDTVLAKNYTMNASAATGRARIWPLPVIVSFGADDRDYEAGNSAAAVTVGSVSIRLADAPEAGAPALPASLSVSPVYQKDFDLKNVQFVDADGNPTDQVGTHQVTVTAIPVGDATTNYVWKGVEPASATIRGIELTASAAAPGKTYDSTVHLVGDVAVTLTNGTVTLTQGTDFTVESAVFDRKDADNDAGVTVQIKLTDEAAKTYTIRQTDRVVTDATTGVTTIQTTAKISQKEIKLVSAVADDKKYDGTTAANAHNLVFKGLVPGEVFAADDYTYTAAFDSAAVGSEKAVTVTVVLVDNEKTKNYSLVQNNCIAYADITAIALNAVLAADAKAYDGTVDVPEGGYSLDFTDEDSRAMTLVENRDYRVISGPAFSEKNAGEHTVSMTIELMGDAAQKYALANGSLTAKAEIMKKALTPSVTNVPDKVYDGTAQVVNTSVDALTVSLSGWIAGEELQQGADYTVSGQFRSKDNKAAKDAAEGKLVTVAVALTDSALAQNYYLSPAVVAGSADIAKRPLTIAAVTAADKLHDGTADTTVTALSFSNTLEGEPLTRDVDWRIASAQFDTADTGLDKPVRVVVELLDNPVSKNYVLAQNWADTAADITDHLDVNGAYTGEVSSGSLTVDEVDSWIHANFTDVFSGKPQVVFKDKDGGTLTEIDKSQASIYTVEAAYSDGIGRTVTYHIQWTLTAKPLLEPAPSPTTPAPPAAAPIGVQTGDSFPLALLFIGLTLALTGIVVILIVDHKRKQNRN